jgi:adenosylcobinamide-GDP ribazoletransferase
MCVKPIRSLLQFATILPMGGPVDLGDFARHSYLYPVAGYVIGGIVGFVVYWVSPSPVAAALAVAGVLLLSGAHHFDGLLDLGDGLMAHGTRDKRIAALTDRQVGAGGIALGGTVSLLTFAGLLSSPFLAWAVLIGEVGAKFSMTFLTAYGAPFNDGIHSFLFRQSRWYFPVLAAALVFPLILAPVPRIALAGAGTAMILVPLALLGISRRCFGGVNGDVVGASNELSRAAIVLILTLTLS